MTLTDRGTSFSACQGVFVHDNAHLISKTNLSIFPIYINKSTETFFQRILVTIEYFTNFSVDLSEAILGLTASWVVTFGLSFLSLYLGFR